MGQPSQKRLKSLCEIAALKAEKSQASFARADQTRRALDTQRAEIQAQSAQGDGTDIDNMTAALRFGAWQRTRIAELQVRIAQEYAKVQPIKEAAQRDAARRDVAEELLARAIKSERRRAR